MRYVTFALAFLAAACTAPAPSRHGGTGGGGGGDAGGTGGVGGGGGGGGAADGGGGGTSDGCSDAARLVYVIDDDGTFSSFKPDQTDVTKSVFTDLGTLSCPVGGGALSDYKPFSMSVDRDGTAWVELVDQNTAGFPGPNELFKVSTKDASCTATTFKGGQSGFEQFGMGFVSNAAMSAQETLFLAGATTVTTGGQSQLGTIDLGTFAITPVGMLNGNPELTGTGLGDLWGFFPDAKNARIAKLDKTNASESGTIALPSAAGSARDWAFAFYGGDFWVFLANGTNATVVYHVTPNGPKDQLDTKTRHIVGAGVSTCAPTVPIG